MHVWRESGFEMEIPTGGGICAGSPKCDDTNDMKSDVSSRVEDRVQERVVIYDIHHTHPCWLALYESGFYVATRFAVSWNSHDAAGGGIGTRRR